MPADVEAILERLSLAQKIDLMSGDTGGVRQLLHMAVAYNFEPIPGGTKVDPAIPGIHFSDGPRGIVMDHATCFPAAIGRGATWDPDLEREVAEAMGAEAKALGANLVASNCINLLRHPAWGRAQETFGEDPVHVGAFGEAHVRGMQTHVMSCVKHYACNSIENARFKVDVRIGERTLHEVYLPHFKRCIDAGAASVMSAYNRVNGDYCGENRKLLTDILKVQWGFDGFVMTDFFMGVRDAVKGVNAGLDMEMPLKWRFKKLAAAAEDGRIDPGRIDDACRRLLRQQFAFAAAGSEKTISQDVVACDKHRQLARAAATGSIVLLKNEDAQGTPMLPLSRDRVKTLAVIGKLADVANIGDKGSSRVRPRKVVTPLEGIRTAAGEMNVIYDDGSSVSRARKVAAEANAVIVVAGYTHRDEGEYLVLYGGDRDALTLKPNDERLIQAVASANPNTAVTMFGGSAIVTDTWRDRVAALLMAWYPGMEGGHAIADVLFGNVNPSGKLPCVFPAAGNTLPPFDKKAKRIKYEYLHGQRWLDARNEAPAFPLGFGLSYSEFEMAFMGVDMPTEDDADVIVCVTIRNTGLEDGATVVQIYASKPESKIERPPRWLVGFQRVELAAGASCELTIAVPQQRLAYYDVAAADWNIEPGGYTLWVGDACAEAHLQAIECQIDPA